MQFDAEQERVLRAALDRLIPADDFPGAWEAGVGEYIRRQLSGDLQHHATAYMAGLAGLDAEARAEYGTGFAALLAEQQDAVLKRVESGDIKADWPTPPRAFFNLLVCHTAEGYYADPGQGGNHDKVSWKMIGFLG